MLWWAVPLGLFVLLLFYLVVIIFFPLLKVPPQPLDRRSPEPGTPPDFRQDAEFQVGHHRLKNWLYLPPKRQGPCPAILLLTGFGGTKDIILEQYALAFAEQGWASLALEFRHFGESQGEPRQLFSFLSQEQDIRASIAYLREREEIDPARIFLWGTSAGGPYSIIMAGEDPEIAGAIVQCASLDHKKDDKIVMKREGLGYFLKIIAHAQRDKGRSRFGLPPHRIPMVGKPGTMALLNGPGAWEGYSSLVHPGSTFSNETCPRVMLMPLGPKLFDRAEQVQCPVLILVCSNDQLVAPDSHVRVAEIMGDLVTVKKYPIGHFDIYQGEHFIKASKDQIEFIHSCLDN